MKVAERIKTLCDERGISGVELGRRLGLSKSPLTDWKNGKSKPTLEQVVAMCEIFATSADWLLTGNEPVMRNITSPLSEEALEVAELYDKLDKPGRAIILGQIYARLDTQQASVVSSTINYPATHKSGDVIKVKEAYENRIVGHVQLAARGGSIPEAQGLTTEQIDRAAETARKIMVAKKANKKI